MFTAVINNRITRWCEEKEKLTDNQAGFRSNRSTLDQMFILHEIIQSRRMRKQKTYCCFLDLKKAYDTLFRDGLWERLLRIGIKSKLWRILCNIYDHIESCIKINGVCTDWFEVLSGVRQGCILSPILFIIFIDGLAKAVIDSVLGPKIACTLLTSNYLQMT